MNGYLHSLINRCLFFFLAYCLLPACLFSQGTWLQKANFSGTARAFGVGFSIGAKGYMGMGEKYTSITWTCYKDFWEFDPVTNTWTQKASFGGVTRIAAVGFSIGTKGYVGTGTNSNTWTYYNDFWEYDPATNIWTQKANFIGARAFAVGFSIGNKGYIGTGSDSTTEYNDFWEWDQATDTWTQKSNFQGGLRESAAGFSIGNKGYIGTGCDLTGKDTKDFWQWDQATDTWTQKTNFVGQGREGASGFSIGNYGYIGIGDTTYTTTDISLSDFWQYNPSANTWTQMANYGGGVTGSAAAFVIGCKGYVGTGEINGSPTYVYKDDFWEFTPAPSMTAVNVDCFGNNTGSAAVTVYGIPSYTYSWSSAPVQTTQTATGLYAGTYFVTVIDSAGCICSDSVVIATPTGLTVLSPIVTKPDCFGTSTGTAMSTATGGTPAYSYSWNPTSQTTETATGLAAGVYTITITDNNGCIIKTLVSVTQPTAIIASISADTSICYGTSATENLFASGGTPGYSYLWMTMGDTTSSIIISPSSTTTYTAQVADANGCSYPQLITKVTVAQNPVASISYTPGSCTASVQFIDNSTNVVAWNWNFGDGNTSSVQQPSHVYSTPGTYSVALTLSSQLGCKTTDNIVVDVSSFSKLYIPNAFSPNDDGRDDVYYVFGKCIAEMTFKVFDRWGEKIFETTDPATGWDGRYKGQMENTGVFMYDFNGTLTTGEKVNQKGNITLMR